MDIPSISPLTARLFGAARSPKQINHRMRTERPHRCDLAQCLSGGVGAIGEAGRDYVQDERYIAMEHMGVRRDWFRFAQWFTNRHEDNVRPGTRREGSMGCGLSVSRIPLLYTTMHAAEIHS